MAERTSMRKGDGGIFHKPAVFYPRHSTGLAYPRHSMYAIYAYIDPQNHPNVGIYGIHGVSGIYSNLNCLHRKELPSLPHLF